jgi:hypothetical protein
MFDNGVSVGVGTASPSASAKMDINGQIKISGGTPGAGKVLTSDATGLATWQTPASGGGSSAGFAGYRDGLAPVQNFAASGLPINVDLKQEEFDDAAKYNSATSTYTTPSAGLYHFDVSLMLDSTNNLKGSVVLSLYVGGTGNSYSIVQTVSPKSYTRLTYSVNIKLAANETVQVQLTNMGSETLKMTIFDFDNRFSGYKVY